MQKFKNIDSLKLFYNSNIKFILIYGSIIWSLKQKKGFILRIFAYKQNIEFDYFKHDYNELCVKFKINILGSARAISDLKFLYKLINNKIVCNEIRSVIDFYIPKRDGIRGRNLTFIIPIEFKIAKKRHHYLEY